MCDKETQEFLQLVATFLYILLYIGGTFGVILFVSLLISIWETIRAARVIRRKRRIGYELDLASLTVKNKTNA